MGLLGPFVTPPLHARRRAAQGRGGYTLDMAARHWARWPARFPVTFGIGALTLAFFGLEHVLGGTTDAAAQMRLGALRPDRIWREGELYRLWMPMLLHQGPIHLVMNGLAFVQLMALTEHVYGSARALTFYVVCGVVAAWTTAWLGPPWMSGSVGASGAILGLAGLLLGAAWYGREPWRGQLFRAFGQGLLRSVLLTFAIGIGSWFVFPIVDNWAHAGGFGAGLLLAALHRNPEVRSPTRGWLVGAVAGGSWLAAMGWTALDGGQILERFDQDTAERYALRAAAHGDGVQAGVVLAEMTRAYHRAGMPRQGRLRLRDRLAEAQDPTTPQTAAVVLYDAPGFEREVGIALEHWVRLAPGDPLALNALAWHLLTRPDEVRRESPRAERLAAYALDLLPPTPSEQRAATLDTRAEALFQMGRWDEAATLQREAVRMGEEVDIDDLPAMRARLDRIEAARNSG